MADFSCVCDPLQRRCNSSGLKGRHTRRDQSLRVVPSTSPLKSSHEGTGLKDLVPLTVLTKRSEEQIAGTCPKNQTDLNL